MRDILLALIFLGVLPVILRRPQIGVLAWMVVSLANPHRLTWGFAFDFPFAFVIAIATLIGFLVSKEPKRISWTAVPVILALFLVWMTFTTFFALNQEDAWDQWEKVMKIQFMSFIALAVMTSQQRLNQLVWVTALSIGFYGLKGGLFALTSGGEHKVWGPEGSFIQDNNALALAIIMVVPLIRFLQQAETNKLRRLGLGALMVICILSCFASYSRGAVVAMVAMLGLLWIKGKQKFLIGIALTIALVGIIAFMPDQWFERVRTISEYKQDASAMGRLNAWGFAYNVAVNRPVVCGGFEVFTEALFHRYAPDPLDHHDAHSIYFEVLGEHGFIGLLLFFALGIAAWRANSWIIRTTSKRGELGWYHSLAGMLQVCLIGYATGGLFLGLAYFDLYYILLVMTAAMLVQVRLALNQNQVPDARALRRLSAFTKTAMSLNKEDVPLRR